MKLAGKVALITGASKGIGAATARALSAEGATVLINYNQDTVAAQSVLQSIQQAGGNAEMHQADVTNASDVERMFAEIGAKHSTIDILVGNAGGLLADEGIGNVDVFKQTFDLNLFSQVAVVRGVLPMMKSGKIILMSSVHGGLGRGEGRVIAYSAAKAALNSYMKNLAKELAPNILVNAVSPGRTMTPAWGDMTGKAAAQKGEAHATGRMVQPGEIADGVLFLVQHDSMCGEILTIDGGMSLTTLKS